MERQPLGDQGLRVSRYGLGCMGMSEFYGSRNLPESRRVLARALDLGIDFLDTADIYGSGHNETLLGEFLRETKAEVVVATKFGIVRDPNDPGARGVSGRPEYVRRCCDASLRRLGVETIDLYYQHRVDPEVPIEETVGAMAGLVESGKVRFLGLSEASASTLRRACAVHPISAVQTEYSIWSREPEAEILPACRALGVGFVAYSPLGRGFLTGTVRATDDLVPGDYRRSAPRFGGTNLERNLALLARLEAVAKEKDCSPAQLALAWLTAQGDDVVPIPGTKRVRWLEENAAARKIELTASDLDRIDSLAPLGVASGDRYPHAGMQWIDG